MAKEIKFSVLMTVYFREKPDCLFSALNSIYECQTVKPNEVIVVKDGALTQELEDVLNIYITKFPKIFKIYSLEVNQGLSSALNYGATKVNYEYIARMDSDDIAFPNRFELQISYLEENNLDIVGGQIIEFGENIEDIVSCRNVPISDSEIKKVMKVRSPLSHPTIIFRKQVFDQLEGYDANIFPEDYDFFVRASQKNFKFGNITENILWFRIGKNKNEAIKRRHGYNYMKNEFKLYRKFFKIGYYNVFEFLKVVIFKLPIRVLPFPIFKFLYYNLFRKL